MIVYPEPDPVLRLIPTESMPNSFWQMPAQLRSQRARVYLVARLSGQDPMVAWLIAMDVGEENNAFCAEIAAKWSDQALIDDVAVVFPNGLP